MLRVGSRDVIIKDALTNEKFVMFVGLFIIFYGLTLGGISLLEMHNPAIRDPYAYLGMTAVFSGIWFVLETGVGQLFTGATAWLQWAEVISLSLIAFPLVRFMDVCEQGAFHKFFIIVCGLDLMVLLLELIMTVRKLDVVMILGLVHLVFFVSAFLALLSGVFLVKKERKIYEGIRWVVVSSVIFALCGVAEIVNFYVAPAYGDGTFFIIGDFTFLVCCFIWLMQHHMQKLTGEKAFITQSRMRDTLLQNITGAIERPAVEIASRARYVESTGKSDISKNAAKEIMHEADRILLLLQDMSDYIKLQNGMVSVNNVPYEMGVLMEHVEKKGNLLSKKSGVLFVCSVEPGMPRALLGDIEKIQRIADVLLEGAFHFTETGSVEASFTFSHARIGRAGELVLVVRDTGRGVPEGATATGHLFWNREEGAGGDVVMELEIVRDLSRLLGGDLKIEEMGEDGTTVTVNMPQRVVDAYGYQYKAPKDRTLGKG